MGIYTQGFNSLQTLFAVNVSDGFCFNTVMCLRSDAVFPLFRGQSNVLMGLEVIPNILHVWVSLIGLL